jgi:hypothetical protein
LHELPAAWMQPVRRPRRVLGEIPEALDDLVMSLLSLDPVKRPKSAAEVIDWLTAIGQLPADDSPAAARSFLTTSRLCGREGARKMLDRIMRRAAAGQHTTLLVEGGPGTGKSRILAEAAVIAQTSGLTVVRAVARTQHGAGCSLAQDLATTLRQNVPAEAARAERFESRPSLRPSSDAESVELRSRMQQTLLALFREVASERPLAVIVDDLDRADEFSVAFVVALAHQARDLPLAIVASRSEGQHVAYPSPSSALAERALGLRLHDLDRTESHELLESMFGPVPNLERLSAWTFRVARGNPKLTTALAEYLLERGSVRYVDGAWVLPSDEIVAHVPPDLVQTLALRLETLSPAARALAELLGVRRGGATAELCLRAGAGSAEEVFAALDELVRARVLECAGHEHAFAQEELRNVVCGALSAERARALHQRWADALLAEPDSDLDTQLEVGWHLIHTEQELRGAEMLARVGPLLVEQGHAMAAALPAIEAALAILERHGGPLDTCLRLRSTLVLSGYLFDYRLATRYGEQTLALLHRTSGLGLAERLARFVGRRLGFALALALTAFARLWLPRERRGPPVIAALQYFVRAAMGLIGVRAVALDAPGTAAVLAKVEPLAGSPRFIGLQVIYRFCQALVLQMCGREAELDRTLRDALAMLKGARNRYMSAAEHQELLVGVLTSDGINECYRESSRALERADHLEQIGTSLARSAAHRIRLIHALTRGDLERAEECRRALNLHGIQGGTTWQVEWFAAPIEGMLGGANWSDLGLMRRSLERLEQLAQEIPSLRPHLHSNQIAYHFRRGEFELAVELGERYVREHPPHTLSGWGPTYAVTALALIEAGDVRRARELCEHARAHVSEADAAYTVMYGQLEMAHATALAVLGERQRAEAITRSHVEHRRAAGDHAGLVAVHQDRARIARLLDDRTALDDALRAMRMAALDSACPALVLLADRTAELRAPLHSPPPQLASLGSEADTQVTEPSERGVAKFLRGARTPGERCRQALRLLARCTASDEAYLFACEGGELTLVTALEQRGFPEPLTTQLRALLRREPQSFELCSTQLPDGNGIQVPFHVILLAPAEAPGVWTGAAVLRDTGTSQASVTSAMLAELCSVLAEDLRLQTEQSRAKRAAEPS